MFKYGASQRGAPFLLKMKYRIICVISALLALYACNNSPKVLTYADAERQFLSSITEEDTLQVISMGSAFMDNLKSGQLDSALSVLCMIDNYVLYKLGDESIERLRSRFTAMPVVDYCLARFSFSTQASNDLVYRYSFSGPVSSAPGMKIVLNPVKIEGKWYLAIKDGYQYSDDLSPEERHQPLDVAPYPVRLNKMN